MTADAALEFRSSGNIGFCYGPVAVLTFYLVLLYMGEVAEVNGLSGL